MAFSGYANTVIENKMTDLVNTTVNVNSLFTTDTSLTTEAGLTKTINKYTYAGKVEKLAKGAKNSTKGSVSYKGTPYTVERYQQTFTYNDDEVMQDPYLLDVATKGASDLMANEIREEYFAELAKIQNTNAAAVNVLTYDAIVDALAEIGKEVESDMFLVMGLDSKAAIRKDADYKASKQGEILYTGQFGDICGVPCVCSKLVPANTVYITTKDAVKFFVKKDGTVEQDRDIETKDNTVVYSRYGVMALVDETKSYKLKITPAA